MKKLGAVLLVAGVLGGCGGGALFSGPSNNVEQPVPADYKAQMAAFFRTYLKDPREIREAVVAEPAQRTVGGNPRYVVCTRFNARDNDGNYRGASVRAVVFVDGRLDRAIEPPGDLCAGVAYAPFPELQALQR